MEIAKRHGKFSRDEKGIWYVESPFASPCLRPTKSKKQYATSDASQVKNSPQLTDNV